MDITKVKFIYAYPLDRGRRELFKQKDLGTYPTIEEVKSTIEKWEKIWEEENKDDKIVKELIDVTKRVPERSLECFVFGGGLNSMSTPFLMSVTTRSGALDDERFIDTLIHEIIHIFVTSKAKDYWDLIGRKYADEQPIVRNHIIVYAILEHTYDKFFERKPIDYSRSDISEGYKKAVEIVKNEGYEKLIKEFQRS